MRNLVQPLPSVRCDLCNGELLLKLIRSENLILNLDVQIFDCGKCGHEQSYVVHHDRYAAHTANNMPRAKVG